ncbi:uncharacterized protein TNCT_186591 [Trichonephila clavata]|uniref:Transposase n=1 Tax=Trichonephila clavata TaxID=2740835 RepID=A0A8X6HB42_TRICU|nr:uncharacterized protein TNCT_186591 [Trichonephila clavata]
MHGSYQISNRLRKACQTLSARKHGYRLFGCSRNLDYRIHDSWSNNKFQSLVSHVEKTEKSIWNKRRGLLSSGIVVLQDNVRPHTAVKTREVLRKFNMNASQHHPCPTKV